MKNLLLILFIGVIVSSCQKEDVFILEGSYKLPPTMTVGKVRMYTSKGEIADEAKIRKFLKENPGAILLDDLTDYFSFNESLCPVYDEDYLDITINPDKAIIHTNQQFGTDPDIPHEVDIFKQDNLIVLSKGTELVGGIIDFIETNGVAKIKTFSHKRETAAGYTLGRANLALLEQNGQLVLPRLVYVHKSYWKQDSYGIIAGSSWNILNKDFLTRIPVNDTIVAQEGWAIMQKQ